MSGSMQWTVVRMAVVTTLVMMTTMTTCVQSVPLFNMSLVYSTNLYGRLFPVNQYTTDCTLVEIMNRTHAGASCWGGAARRATFIRRTRAENNATLVIDLGGSFFGSIFYRLYRGNASMDLLDRLEYDALAMDVADMFDSTQVYARLLRRLYAKRPQMLPVVISNVDVTYDDSMNALNSSIMATSRVAVVDGRSVGIISLTPLPFVTQLAKTKHNVTVTALRQAVWLETSRLALAEPAPNIVILVTRDTIAGIRSIISATMGVDVVLAPEIPNDAPFVLWETDAIGRNVPICGSIEPHGRQVGFSNMSFDSSGNLHAIGGRRVDLSFAAYPETESMDIWNYTIGLNDTVTSQVRNNTVGTAKNTWLFNNCKYEECLMGNVIADAMRYTTRAQIAVWNAGGIRHSVSAGAVSSVDVFLAVPFQNRLVTVRMRGSSVLEMLQHSVTLVNDGGFLQVSGLKFQWNTNAANALASRVGAAQVAQTGGGTDYSFLDVEQFYTVAISDFLANGGDGYTIFADTTKAVDPQYDFPEADQSIGDYISSFDTSGGLEATLDNRIVNSAQTFTNVLVRIGSIFDTGEEYQHFRIALSRINNPFDGHHDTLTPGVYYTHVNDVNDCQGVLAGPAALEFGQSGVNALVGAQCSGASTAVASIAKVFKMPQISYASTSPSLSDKNIFPYFNRVVSPDTLQGRALASMCAHYGWRRVAVIHDDSLYGTGIDLSFREAFLAVEGNEIAVDVTMKHLVSPQENLVPDFARMRPILQQVRATRARVVVALMSGPRGVFDLFGAVHTFQIMPPPSVQWVGIDGWAYDTFFASQLNTTDPNLRDNIMRGIRGSVALIPYSKPSPTLAAYVQDWGAYNSTEYKDANGDRSDITSFGTFAYDAMVALAHAFDAVIRAGKQVNDGEAVLAATRALSFQGLSGRVSFDDNGDRENLPFAIVVANHTHESWDVHGVVTNGTVVEVTKSVHFADGSTHVPFDGRGPVVIFSGADCTGDRLQLDSSGTLCGVKYAPLYVAATSTGECLTTAAASSNAECVISHAQSVLVAAGYTVRFINSCSKSGGVVYSMNIPPVTIDANSSASTYTCRTVDMHNIMFIDVFPTFSQSSSVQNATAVVLVAGGLTCILLVFMCYYYGKKRNRNQIEDDDTNSAAAAAKSNPRVVASKSLADSLLRDMLTQLLLICAEMGDLASDWLVARSVLSSDSQFTERFQILYLCVVMVATIASIRSMMERIRLSYHIHVERTKGIRTMFSQTLLDAKNPIVMLNRTTRDIYGFHLSWLLLFVEDVPSIMFTVVILNTKNALDWTVNTALMISCLMIGAKLRGIQMYFHLVNRRRALRTLIATKAAKSFKRSTSVTSMSGLEHAREAYSNAGVGDVAAMLMQTMPQQQQTAANDASTPSAGRRQLRPQMSSLSSSLKPRPAATDDQLMGLSLSRYESVYAVSGATVQPAAPSPARSSSPSPFRHRIERQPTVVALARRPRPKGEQTASQQ